MIILLQLNTDAILMPYLLKYFTIVYNVTALKLLFTIHLKKGKFMFQFRRRVKLFASTVHEFTSHSTHVVTGFREREKLH